MKPGSIKTLDWRLIADIDKCTGCRSCTLVCAFVKHGVFSAELARIRVLKFEDGGVDAPIFCQQCEAPRCVEACPRDAIVHQPESGILRVDNAACDGCAACLVACPYGAISLPADKVSGKLALMCDLCGGEPRCIPWCETGALKRLPVTETAAITHARDDMVMARKRFEIEHGAPLWKSRLRRQRGGRGSK